MVPTSTGPEDRRPTFPIEQGASDLLETLPENAGGVTFESFRVVDDALNVGHPVDDALDVLEKERRDAVSVFRYSEDAGATIGATAVDGVDGADVLKAFVDTWHAPAVIRRWQRTIDGRIAWELGERDGRMTVLYLRGDTVYLVSTPNAGVLEAILAEMPRGSTA